MQFDYLNTKYDSQFESVAQLNWLPWVGDRYSDRPEETRLMVLGESNYNWSYQGRQDDNKVRE